MKVHALLGGLLLVASTQAALADMHRCYQADGSIRFADQPCPVTEMTPAASAAVASTPQAAAAPTMKAASASAPAAPVRVAPPQRLVSIPPTVNTAPATVSSLAEGEAPRPNKRQRDVLAISAQLERCRMDQPGFAEQSEAIYDAWLHRHAEVLTRYAGLLAAKLRAGRHGEATLPLAQCTTAWLQGIEPLTHLPDPRFSTVERTWQLFIGALMTGDRATLVDCLAGPVRARWQQSAAHLADDDLRRIGASVRALKVEWGDDYEKEGLVADTSEHAYGIGFRNINEEWKITQLGATTMAAPLP